MAGKKIEAGDLIDGMLVVEVAEKYWGWDQTAIFLVPPESEHGGSTSGREWVLKRPRPVIPGAVVPDELKRVPQED